MGIAGTMQLPVTVLNANKKSETGKKAQFGNIAAAKVGGRCIASAGEVLLLEMSCDARSYITACRQWRTSSELRWDRAPC